MCKEFLTPPLRLPAQEPWEYPLASRLRLASTALVVVRDVGVQERARRREQRGELHHQRRPSSAALFLASRLTHALFPSPSSLSKDASVSASYRGTLHQPRPYHRSPSARNGDRVLHAIFLWTSCLASLRCPMTLTQTVQARIGFFAVLLPRWYWPPSGRQS